MNGKYSSSSSSYFWYIIITCILFFFQDQWSEAGKGTIRWQGHFSTCIMVAAKVKAKFSKSEMCFMLMAREDPPSIQLAPPGWTKLSVGGLGNVSHSDWKNPNKPLV